MASSFKALFRGAASVSPATLYTTPANTTTMVTVVVVTNTAGTAGTYTILLDGVELFSSQSIAANSSATHEIKQIIHAGDAITASASATTVKFHVSGLEMI